jgi:hypothetical protein
MVITTRGTLMIAYDFAFVATGIASIYARDCRHRAGPFERQSGVYRKPHRFATRETGEMPRYYQLL